MITYLKHICLFLFLVAQMPVRAAVNDTFQDDHYSYQILSEDEATVAVAHWIDEYDWYECKIMVDLIIPETVVNNGKTYTVTTIKFNAFDSDFDHRKPIRSISFPSTLKEIQAYAFRYSQLQTLHLPEGLEKIGEGAFTNNYDLKEISFPQSLRVIEGGAFMQCHELCSLELPRKMTSIGAAAFENCINLMAIKMPEKLGYLGAYAFWGCAALNTISLSPGLQGIGNYTFANCINLEEITIGEGVGYIGEHAFDNCKNLSKVNLPNSLREIGRYSFLFCSDLESIHIPEGVTYIGDAAFGWCDRLRDINIPKGVTEFTKHLTAHTDFQTFKLPENIEAIGVGCFMECYNLLGVTIPSKVKLIDEGAFIKVPKLQFVNVRSAEPPTITGETFDRYDLTLYVPLNCKAAYQEAPHWKNFTDIREIDNAETVPVNYPETRCTLTIRDSEKGETILYVEKGTSPVVQLSPSDGKAIRQLLFNNQDVTYKLHSNNRIHLPRMTQDSTLELSYTLQLTVF